MASPQLRLVQRCARRRAYPSIAPIVMSVGLVLAACSGAPGQATTAPSIATSPVTPPATVAVTASPSTPIALDGGLFYARFIEATHTFTGMFASRPDGSNEVSIPMPWTEGGGRWSRSGKFIAVATQLPDGRVSTAIIGSDGSVDHTLPIADPTLNLGCAAWSRDDTRLACQGWDDAHPTRAGIYTVRASDGGDLRRVTTAPDGMIDEVGDYSPAGQLVFKRHAGDEGDGPLLLVDAAGGAPTTLTASPMEDTGRFSPDGKLVVTSGQGRLVVFDLSGKIVYAIATDGAYLFGPVWSPDGTRIAFSLSASGPFADVYTSLPDGTDRQQVTKTPTNEITVDWVATGG